MFPTTRDFVAALEASGQLRRISAAVDPVLEIAQITDRVSKSAAPVMPSQGAKRTDPRFHHLGGPALLFENVRGSDIPVLINAWGSYARMEMALGCHDSGHTPGGFEALAAKIGSLVKPQPPRSLTEIIAKAREFLPLLRIPPKRTRGPGLCQQIIKTGEQVDLTTLPLIRCWPHDGDFAALGYPADVNAGIPGLADAPEWERHFRGRYVTLAGIHTIHADDVNAEKPASHNIGMYRVQLLGKRRMAMHWHMHHDGARHWRSWKARGERMPVAIALGGESVMPYAATAPLPPGISELLLAGFLNRGGIPMARARTVPLWVPANAEIVIEGYVSNEAGLIGFDPRDTSVFQADSSDGPPNTHQRSGIKAVSSESRPTKALGPGAVFEGPFGDHTGFYSMPDRYPILDVTAITHRRDPIYPTTIVGLPPQEDYYLGKATERLFFPLLKTIIHDIEDYDLPMFGAFHNCAVVRIKKAYPLQGRRVMHSVWGAGQMAWTKSIFVVDDDVDVHDTAAVLRAAGEHCVPGRDIETVRGPLDILDHAAPFLGAGAKWGFDATRKNSDAEKHRVMDALAAESCAQGDIGPVLADSARGTEARARTIEGVLDARIPAELGGWWMFIKARKDNPGDGAKVIEALGTLPNEVEMPRWTVVVGPDADAARFDDALFHWTAQCAFERDAHLSKCGRRIAFDATPKLPGDERHAQPVRAWPPILRTDDATRQLVERRWGEYAIER
ncbi:MAG: UbiD family decarboxylase domain-containing protein [Phycisphaerales bacterium]